MLTLTYTNELFLISKDLIHTKKQILSIYNNKLFQRKFVLIFALHMQHTK